MKYIVFGILSIGLSAFLFFILAKSTEIDERDFKVLSDPVQLEYSFPGALEAECGVLNDNVFKLISRSKSCEQHSDCAVTSFGCPFGCQTAVNKATIENIRFAISSSCSQCKYRCPNNFFSTICVNNQCELQRIEKPPF